ncbi:hypothetical protein FJZ26_02915 [Candidatus Parvarchaeota archaeon]|nr:hypothetical protein [Candidatus Parvarchaeota archaeon]
MVSIKKTLGCKCGKFFTFDFSADMEIEDLTITSKCGYCGSTILATISSFGRQVQQSPAYPQSSGQTYGSGGLQGLGEQAGQQAASTDYANSIFDQPGLAEFSQPPKQSGIEQQYQQTWQSRETGNADAFATTQPGLASIGNAGQQASFAQQYPMNPANQNFSDTAAISDISRALSSRPSFVKKPMAEGNVGHGISYSSSSIEGKKTAGAFDMLGELEEPISQIGALGLAGLLEKEELQPGAQGLFPKKPLGQADLQGNLNAAMNEIYKEE